MGATSLSYIGLTDCAGGRYYKPLVEQSDAALDWRKFGDPELHCAGKIMVCGHTPQESGVPLSNGNAVCIDTLAHGGGWLTCLDVDSRQYWQANQDGEIQFDILSNPPEPESLW